jgi:hypothetical protein
MCVASQPDSQTDRQRGMVVASQPAVANGAAHRARSRAGRRPLLAFLRARQVLACIGEQFDDGDEVCGIVVNVRAKQDRISMWTKTASNEAAQVRATRSPPPPFSSGGPCVWARSCPVVLARLCAPAAGASEERLPPG